MKYDPFRRHKKPHPVSDAKSSSPRETVADQFEYQPIRKKKPIPDAPPEERAAEQHSENGTRRDAYADYLAREPETATSYSNEDSLHRDADRLNNTEDMDEIRTRLMRERRDDDRDTQMEILRGFARDKRPEEPIMVRSYGAGPTYVYTQSSLLTRLARLVVAIVIIIAMIIFRHKTGR